MECQRTIDIWKKNPNIMVFMLSIWSIFTLHWGPLHTRDWEPMTITPQAFSLMEKAEPVQVCFTLRSSDQQSMWMLDECKVYMDS